jgi:hypothetical protein
MKSIHKFNGSLGATLCNQCSVIITTGLTDDLYCEECKDHRKKLLIEIMKEDEALGLYIEQMEKEELKQETLEEAAERFYNTEDLQRDCTFIEGAKWQQEQDKNKYSEEDLDTFRKFMIQEQNFSKSSLGKFNNWYFDLTKMNVRVDKHGRYIKHHQ